MIDGSIVSFECEVVNSVSLVESDEAYPAAHTLFVGEVKGVWVNKKAIKNNTIYYKNLSPIIYVPSNGYWSIRENEGRVFNRDNRKLVPKKK
jgi:flavin reductase (DIM6/NTAB) family NADH-FMN oxidoreductase RutF